MVGDAADMDANADASMDAAPAGGQLTVVLAGAGFGTITSSPAGIDCGVACTAAFSSDVSLVATPAPGSVLAGWSDASCGIQSCVVQAATLPRSITATFATFTPSDITLTPSTIDFGSVVAGTMVTRTLVLQNDSLTAVPIAVVGGLGGGLSLAPTTTCGMVLAAGATCRYDLTFAVTGYGSAQGTFDVRAAGIDYKSSLLATIVMPVDVTVVGPGIVTSHPAGIDCGTTCTALFAEPVFLTATTPPGSAFSGWSATGCTTTTCQVQPGTSVTATFISEPEYTVGGDVTGLTSSGLILQDNGGDYLPISANGSFTFATPVTSTWTYQVRVHQHPTGAACRIDNASGTIGSSNVTNVLVTCSPHSWTMIATGAGAACGLQQDATLRCWGGNYGSLPTQVGTSTTWTNVSVSGGAYCALASDGSLWCWGNNMYGQLGNGTTGGSNMTPGQVASANPWLAVDTGGGFVCGIQSGGSLWCWGRGDKGQVGDGALTGRSTPTRVGTASNWSSVSAGAYHACGIQTDGSLWCWGSNDDGCLGDGTMTPHARPERIGTATWRSVSAGQLYTCGIQTDGTLWCWGYNFFGTLGDGTTTRKLTPVQVGTSQWATASAGDTVTCGTQPNASLWCWGTGARGDGVFNGPPQVTPEQIATFANWTSVAPTTDSACALATDKSLWCWGGDYGGQLGDGISGNNAAWALYPQQVAP